MFPLRQIGCVSRSCGPPMAELKDLSTHPPELLTSSAAITWPLPYQIASARLSCIIATRQVDLRGSMNGAIALTKATLQALEPLYQAGHRDQKVEVWLRELSPTKQLQWHLFINLFINPQNKEQA